RQNVPKRGRRYSLSLSDLALLALPRTLRLPHQGEGNAAFSKGWFWADQMKRLCRSVHIYVFLSLFLCVCVLVCVCVCVCVCVTRCVCVCVCEIESARLCTPH